ncbi:RNA polymerase subunit sigma-54 [Thermosipho ferrireducens]|uniref:RNA polymerase subunit sigma-54 n=1 Tax=Thermosipho ferrireducens TaxID=2571116 RepID=A0ABX7S641_9BACT|nr:RNA polymerase subunit sigma-54 [Thermosipho ferrireducens]QTA37195.1 RNA polymerase subunit sigma-54 [Thermosipho ferrireducens]
MKLRSETKLKYGLILTKKEKIYLEYLEKPIRDILKIHGENLINFQDVQIKYHEDLHTILIKDIPFLGLSDEEETIAEYIIYNIDHTGKLNVTPEEVAEKYSCDSKDVENIINMIYEFFAEQIRNFTYGDVADSFVPDAVIDDDLNVRITQAPLTSNEIVNDALKKRNETILRILFILVEVNRSFLIGKRKFPRRISMKNISNILDLSRSTVTRAIKNKYISTPRGIFPLSIFFGRKVHPAILKIAISEILKENPHATDNVIVEELRKMGIDVARRTVCKYRNMVSNQEV